MNLSKRILAGAMAVASVFSLVGCGKDDGKKKETATTTTTVKATLNEAEVGIIEEKAESIQGLPDMELANKEVNCLAHYPMNPNDTQAAAADLKLFELKYGGKVIDNVTNWETRYTDLAKLVISGNGPDMFPADDMDAFPKGAIRGMFQPIDDYIDYTDPLWTDTATAADSFAIKDDHYVAVVGVSANYVCVYNPKTIEAEGLDDPAELFANGEWTLDKFAEMCKEFTNEEEEKYGLDGWYYYDAISQTSGLPMISISEDGLLQNNMSDPKIEAVQNFMYELSKHEVVWPRAEHNWEIRGGSDNTGSGMGDNLTLFYPIGLWGIEGTPEAVKLFGDVEAGEIRFVPMPINTDGGNDTHWISARANGFLLCSGARNPEGFKALMYCKKACSLDEDIKELGENQRREVYKWDDTMMDMYDTIQEMALENPVFELHQGVTEELATTFSNTIMSSTMMDGGEGTKTWTTVVSEQKGTVDWLIKEANDTLAAGI